MRKHRRDHRAVGCLLGVEQQPQGVVNPALSFLARQAEDFQVLLDRAARPPVLQHIVGDPESTGRKHRVAVAVLLERSRLAYQPVDDVAVLDAMLAPATKPGETVDLAGAVPDFKGLSHDMNIDKLTDQSAGQRIGVAADVDRAPRIDPRLEPSGHLQSAGWQCRQHGHFFEKSLLSVGIASGHELLEERLIVASTGEIAAPAKHQGLVDRLFEAVMTLLDVAILVGLSRLDRLGFEAVMRRQSLVSPGEYLGLRIGIDRRGQAIGAMPLGNSSQFPQGVLQPFAEALETLGEADRASFPVGVGQHEVIDQVVERLAGDGDAESAHVGEITFGESPRLVGLCEEHLPGRPFEGTHCLIRRCRQRSWTSGKRPGKRRCRSSNRVLAWSPGLSRSSSTSSGQTSWNGSCRVRQVWGTRR